MSKPNIAFEVEWMNNADHENPDYEFRDFPERSTARTFARSQAKQSPVGIAQLREIECGRDWPDQRTQIGEMEEFTG